MIARTGIIGTAQTPYLPKHNSRHITELVYDAVRAALDDAGMEIKDIDNVVSCSQDFLDGRTISNRTIPEAEGAYLKSEAKVASDGAQAALYGALRIMSGKYRTTLVLAHSKMSEGNQNVIANAMFDPLFQRHLGLDEVSAAALQARAYLDRHGLSEDVMAVPASASLGNALSNPMVHRHIECTVDKVMESPMLATPVRKLMAHPITDGACALVLADEKTARERSQSPVWIEGFGISTDAFFLGDRSLSRLPALEEATARAFGLADISDPKKDVGLVELTDYFAHQSLMTLEAMGLADAGEAYKLYRNGSALRDGDLPVNPSGGVLGGNPLCVAGLTRVIECARQLKGEAGPCQARETNKAVAHGSWGPAGQSQCVLVLGT
ncbi:MAG: thiolase family protein [bacterium]